jgi:hypothetical protein
VENGVIAVRQKPFVATDAKATVCITVLQIGDSHSQFRGQQPGSSEPNRGDVRKLVIG